MRTYTVVFEKSSTGWCAFYPDLPGLASCGSSWEEVQALTLEGFLFHLEAMRNDGDPIPAPRHSPDFLEVELPDSFFADSNPDARAA